MRNVVALVVLAALACPAAAPAQDRERPLFYRDRAYGSESQFTPFSSFANWSLDTLQVPASFDTHDLDERFEEVTDHLTNPGEAIDAEGGFGDFVQRQIFPTDFGDLEASQEIVPNYALHLFGGGMVYRKNAEWLAAHGVRYPRTIAAVACMAAELVQEVIEKKSTTDDDEIADFYLFRPAGILLFSNDRFAAFAAHRLGLVEWPHQPMFDPGVDAFVNVGENFAIRPKWGPEQRHHPFVYFGITSLAGTSHPVARTDRISWGVGAAVTRAERNDAEVREAFGLFWDRNDSLMASLIVNGTEGLAARVNVYPGVVGRGRWSPGLFLGVGDDGDVSGGFMIRHVPVGLAGGTPPRDELLGGI